MALTSFLVITYNLTVLPSLYVEHGYAGYAAPEVTQLRL
jgi:hypothetical protein